MVNSILLKFLYFLYYSGGQIAPAVSFTHSIGKYFVGMVPDLF